MRLLWICAGFAVFLGCATPPKIVEQATVSLPAEQINAAALFHIKDGRAQVLDRRGRVLTSLPVDFEGSYSVWVPEQSAVFVAGPKAVHKLSLSGKPEEGYGLTYLGLAGTYPEIENRCFYDQETGYFIQESGDFRVNAAGEVCLRLQDRNDNMMDTAVVVHLPVKGQAKATTVEGTAECPPASKSAPCEFDAFTYRDEKPNSSADNNPVVVDHEGCKATVTNTGNILDFGGMGMSDCPEFFESVSPSGRYMIFSHITDGNDYIYRQLSIIDVVSKSFLSALDYEIVGESSVVWSKTSDALLIDGVLIVFEPSPEVITLGRPRNWLE